MCPCVCVRVLPLGVAAKAASRCAAACGWSPSCLHTTPPVPVQVRAAKSQLRRGRQKVATVEDERRRKASAALLAKFSDSQGELVVLRFKLKDLRERSGTRRVRGLHVATAKVEAAERMQAHVDPADSELVNGFVKSVQVRRCAA